MAKSISKLKDQARSHEQNEEWEKAAQLYQQVLRTAEQEGDIAPELPLFNRVGDIYLRLGRPQDAVTFFEQAADHYAADGLFNNAIALCNKALRHTPGRLELYRKLGRLSANQGFATDARRYFLEYAERNLKQGAVDEAFGALGELADLTDDPEVRELLARQLHSHGRSEAAVDELRRAYVTRVRAGDAAGAEAVRDQVRAIDAAAAETLEEGLEEAPAEEGPLAGLPLLEEPDYRPVPGPEPAPEAPQAAAPPPPMEKLIETERSAAEAELEQQRLAERAATDAERAAAEAAVAAAIAAADEAVAAAEAVEKAADKVKDERAAAAARLQGFDPTLLGDVSSAASAVIAPELERPEEVTPEDVSPLPLLDFQPSTVERPEEELPPLPLPLVDLEEEVVAPPPEVPGLTFSPLDAVGTAGPALEEVLPVLGAPEAAAPAERGPPTFAEPEAAAVAPAEPELPTFAEREAAAVAPAEPELPTFAEPEAAAVAPAEPELPTFAEPEAAAVAPPAPEGPATKPEGPAVAPEVDAEVAAAADRLKATSARLEAQFAPPPPLIPFEEAEGTLAPEQVPGPPAPAPEEAAPEEVRLEELIARLPPAPEPPTVEELRLEELIGEPTAAEAPPSEPLSLRDLVLEEPAEAAPPAASPQPEEMSLRDLILEEEPAPEEPPAQPPAREMNLRDLLLEEPTVEPPAAEPPGTTRPPLEEEPFSFFGEEAIPADWRKAKEEPPAEPEPWAAPEEEAPWAPEEDEPPWAAPAEPEPWATTLEAEPWQAPAGPAAAPPPPPAAPAEAAGDPVVLLARSLYAHGQPAAGRAALDQLLADAERAGNAARMLEVLEALADVEPDDVDVHQRRVDLCLSVQGPRSAVEALLGLAGALERAGEAVRASAAYQQVLDIDPSNATAGAALRKERQARPRKQDAGGFVDLGAMLLAEEPPPPEPTTRFVVAETAPTGDEERDFVEMLEQFKEKVAEHMGEDPVAHYDLGLAYKEMGLLDEAVAEFQIALRNGQDRLKVLEELGRCFMLKEEPRIALRLLGQALAVPDRAEVEYMGVNYLLGRCYEAVGELDAARDAYERVIGLDIQFNDVAERLARL